MNLDGLRAELPVLERLAYLNTGTFGPLPRRTFEAMATHLREELAQGRTGRSYFEDMRALRAGLRDAIGALIGAQAETVALTRSTSDACNIAVASMPLHAEDEVVTTDDEHFGLLGPLHVSGARIRVARIRDLPLDRVLGAIEAEIGPRTRLIALSHVTWTTGRILPVRELSALARTDGLTVLVDGAQAAGAIPVDVADLGCDFYTVSGQKWLLGPDGTGALYVRPERIDDLAVPFPSYFSQQSHERDGAFVPAAGAQRFDSGTVPAAALAGLIASLEFAAEAGSDRFVRARAMAERCRELLSKHVEVLTEAGQATLVSFRPRGGPEETVAALAERGVILRSFPGLDWIRASVGFWTSEEELERLADALA